MKRKFCGSALWLLCCCLLCGCGGEKADVTEEYFLNRAQLRLVYFSEENRYEKSLGSGVWEAETKDGTGLEEYLRNRVMDFGGEMSTLCAMAEKEGFKLSAREKDRAKKAARQVCGELSEADRQATGISDEDVRDFCEKYITADKMMEKLLADVGEISDAQARVEKVGVIDFSSQEDAQTAYLEFEAGVDFERLAAKCGGTYSEQSVCRADARDGYEENVFSLEEGGVSSPFASEGSWELVKVITAYDEAATQREKARLERAGADAVLEAVAPESGTGHLEDMGDVSSDREENACDAAFSWDEILSAET